LEQIVDRGDVESLRVEVRARPVPQFLVAFMARVNQRPEQILVPPRAPTVLRWARALAREASGEVLPGSQVPDLRERDAVPPTVAEVVLVRQAGARFAKNFPECDAVRVDDSLPAHARIDVGVGRSVSPPRRRDELMEVQVMPAHRYLDGAVERDKGR